MVHNYRKLTNNIIARSPLTYFEVRSKRTLNEQLS
jgi:hypothetical protein